MNFWKSSARKIYAVEKESLSQSASIRSSSNIALSKCFQFYYSVVLISSNFMLLSPIGPDMLLRNITFQVSWTSLQITLKWFLTFFKFWWLKGYFYVLSAWWKLATGQPFLPIICLQTFNLSKTFSAENFRLKLFPRKVFVHYVYCFLIPFKVKLSIVSKPYNRKLITASPFVATTMKRSKHWKLV